MIRALIFVLLASVLSAQSPQFRPTTHGTLNNIEFWTEWDQPGDAVWTGTIFSSAAWSVGISVFNGSNCQLAGAANDASGVFPINTMPGMFLILDAAPNPSAFPQWFGTNSNSPQVDFGYLFMNPSTASVSYVGSTPNTGLGCDTVTFNLPNPSGGLLGTQWSAQWLRIDNNGDWLFSRQLMFLFL